jgi:hypothetical protein
MKKRTLSETIMLCLLFTALSLPACSPAGVSPAGAGALPAAIEKYDLSEFARRLRPFVPGHELASPEDPCCEGLFFACERLGGGELGSPAPVFMSFGWELPDDDEITIAIHDLIAAGRQDGYSPRLVGAILAAHCSSELTSHAPKSCEGLSLGEMRRCLRKEEK